MQPNDSPGFTVPPGTLLHSEQQDSCPQTEYGRQAAAVAASQVKRLLPALEEDTLVDALRGLALLGARPDIPWVNDVMLRSHTVMGRMKGGQLATAVWAFSRFKRSPYKQWTFDFFACCRNESPGMAA
jgi:hypothetical protein